MPARCRQVLEALLDSVATDIGAQRCLDLSGPGYGREWFDAHSVAWSGIDRLQADDRFALVICDTNTIHTGLRHVQTDGAVLVLAPSGRTPETWTAEHHIVSRASVRSPDGDWHLCVPELPAAVPYDVSVIITCCDQARYLAALVSHLAEDDSTIRWELVVADRGSFDETGALLRSLQGDVRFLNRPRRTREADAIDAAIHACTGRYAVVLDPRLLPQPGWLASLVRAGEGHPSVGVLLGEIEAAPEAVAAFVPPTIPLFAVQSNAYRARGGIDPELDMVVALDDLLLRMGKPVTVAGLRATIGQPIALPRTG